MKKILNENIEKLINILEKKNVEQMLYIIGNKKEIIKRNILAGIFRGIGIGIGFTIITAIIVYFLQKLVKLNLPILGEYLNDIVEIVQTLNR